jgi:capsular exopolysaccharide synthesis family protein
MQSSPAYANDARPSGSLSAYWRAIRRHWLLASLVTLAAVASSVAWLSTREPKYEATAQVLVTPLAPDDPTYFGLQLIRDSGDDPTRVLRTAATIVRSPRAAQRTASLMGPGWNAKEVLDAVEVLPQGQSSIIEVQARTDMARESARLANTFTRSALAVRKDLLRRQVESLLADLRRRQSETPGPAPELASRITQLETIRTGDDPTLSIVQAATPPTSEVGAGPGVIVFLSLIIGLVLGAAAAILAELLNRRVRDEEEATEALHLPVLARVPLTTHGAGQSKNGAAWTMPPAIHEAFRTVLIQLTSDGAKSNGAIMVTSASSGDGKTTAAIDLATSIAASGHKVLLVDFDLRKPEVATMLGLDDEQDLNSFVPNRKRDSTLADTVTQVPGIRNLSVLGPTGMPGRGIGFVESLHQEVPKMLAEAEKLAEFVVVDSPPLGEVSDALRLVDEVDHIIVVTRPGHTHRSNFQVMRELLQRTPHAPAGLVVLDDTKSINSSYYSYGALYDGASAAGKGRRTRLKRQ